MDLWFGVALLSVFAGGLAQAVTGLGFALVAAPGVIVMLGPRQGVSVVLVLGTLASVLPLMRQYRGVQVRAGAQLLVPTLVAIPLVAALVAGADTRALAVAAGLAIIAGAGLLSRGGSLPMLVSWPGAVLTGACSATLSVIGGVGGPPVALFAANAGWDPRATRATLQAFFLIQGVVTVAVVGPVWPSPAMIVALALGALVGLALIDRIGADAARRAVLGVAALGGLALILGSL